MQKPIPFEGCMVGRVEDGACLHVNLETGVLDEDGLSNRVVCVNANKYFTTKSGMVVFIDKALDQVVATIPMKDITEIVYGYRVGFVSQ